MLQCKLTSLLKTAEDLKIKGLAEVSFHREDTVDEPILPPETNLLDDGNHNDTSNREDQDENHRIEMIAQRMPPALTPIPINIYGSGTAAAAPASSPSQNDTLASQKRKRGRPPLDDSYDTFNM